MEKYKHLLVKRADNLQGKILFINEQIFSVQEKRNKKNERVGYIYGHLRKHLQWFQESKSVTIQF